MIIFCGILRIVWVVDWIIIGVVLIMISVIFVVFLRLKVMNRIGRMVIGGIRENVVI